MRNEQLDLIKNNNESSLDFEKITKEVIFAYPNYLALPEEFYTEVELLKNKTSALREGNYPDQNLPEVRYNKHANYAYIVGEKKERITMGEIISGMEWGKKFNLDPKSFSERLTDQKLYEKYLEAFLRYETLEILNKYIYKIEKEKVLQNTEKASHYAKSEERSKTPIKEMRTSGILAEKMVQSFLTRLSIDNPALLFEVVRVNAYQDIDLKIDFIIRSRNKERGVEVQESKFQLTITSEQRKLEIKNSQMQKFQDVILVKMPELDVQNAFSRWVGEKDPIKSPDQFLDEKSRQMILQKVIGDFTTAQN